MKKLRTKLLIVSAVAFGGFALAQQPITAHASNKISSVPSGNFQVSKAYYSFHWQTFKSGKKTGKVLVIGDFKNAAVRYAVPTKYKLSKSHRTLTTYYRLMNNNKLAKTTYRMDIYKYSNSKYKVKLNQYKAGLLPSYKGKSYTAKVTKSSPAQSYATSYTKNKLFNDAYKKTYDANYDSNFKAAYDSYLKQVTDAYNKQAQQNYQDGKSADPSTPEAQQQINDAALKYVNDNTDKITQSLTDNLSKAVTEQVNKDVNKAVQNLVSAYNAK